jgi:serine/threonine-protein kinase HipA
MIICPITYEEILDGSRYSREGLKFLSARLLDLHDFPYSAEEQRREAEAHSSKLSIQGVQPKLSVRLNIKKGLFEITDQGGKYILKPQTDRYKHLPENEDLTMRLAREVGIITPLHGLHYSKDGTLTYFIKRFDRIGQKGKLHVEDFAQLSGENRDTKYNSSMEKIASVLDKYCTFPAVEKIKLFTQTLFSFLVGNEDMHLKNFSLIVKDGKITLTPAYDLINSTIVLAAPKEELALPIRGRKRKLTKQDFFKYFGEEFLKIPSPIIEDRIHLFQTKISTWRTLVDRSFLPKDFKDKYHSVLSERLTRLGL